MKLYQATNWARIKVVETAEGAGSVHFGGVFSVMEILAAFYQPVIEGEQGFTDFISKNTLVLSKGHCGLAVYSLLGAIGIISESDLRSYCKDGGRFSGHIKRDHELGIGWSTGSLGHGLSVSMGIASGYIASKVDKRVCCIVGDGEMHEGSNWEALLHLGQDPNIPLTVVLDNNQFLSLGRTEEIRGIESLRDKIEAFRIPFVSVDGHNVADIAIEMDRAKATKKSLFLNACTNKGHGISFTRNVAKWHAKRATEGELRRMLKELKSQT